MKIVIDIPEYLYDHLHDIVYDDYALDDYELAIFNGILLPKGHGRLGDLDALIKDLAVYRGGHNEGYGFDGGMYEAYNNSIELVEDAPTVIEAEGET